MMKWYKCLFLVILLFMGCPKLTKALTCSNAEMVKYQELAKNVNVSYEYVEQNSVVLFKIKFTNIQPGLVIKDVKNNNSYNYSSSELELNNFYQGKNYRFDIYTTDANCSGQLLYSHYMSLPYYNPYYISPLCEGIEGFKYCQKWTKPPSSQENFERAIEKYKREQEKIMKLKKTKMIRVF